MKREISFFRDRRANSANALIEAFRALGMSDEEIREELLRLRAAQKKTHPTDGGLCENCGEPLAAAALHEHCFNTATIGS